MAVLSLFAGVVGWLAGLYKGRWEIHRLKKDSIRLSGDHLKHLRDARLDFCETASVMAKRTGELLKLIEADSDVAEVRDKRDEVCSIFAEQLTGAYLSLAELEHLDATITGAEAVAELIDVELVKEFELWRDWLEFMRLARGVPADKPVACLPEGQSQRRFE